MEERLETLLEILERDDYEEILNNRINQITRMNNSIILRSFIRQSRTESRESEDSEESRDSEESIESRDSEESEDNREIDISDIITRTLDNILDMNQQNIPENTNEPLSIESMNKLNRYRVWTYEEGTCGICLENFNRLDKVVELPCKHKFHSKCIMRWFENKCTCPICRFKLNTGENNDGYITDIFRLTRLTLNVIEYGARNLL